MKRYWALIAIAFFLGAGFIFAAESFFQGQPFQKPLALRQVPQLAGGPERETRGFPQRKILDLASMFPGLVFNSGPQKTEKIVALTFDDGPDDVFTTQILDVLRQKKVTATFFIIGNRAEKLPEVISRMVREGHTLANHTWSHPNLMKLDNRRITDEINKTNDLIKKFTGRPVSLFRSPYGSIDPPRVKTVQNLGMKIIAWNVDSLDWKGLSAAEVQTNILENVREGSIVLQHSAGGLGEDLSGTVKALPKIIDVLKKEGYNFVSIPDLLGLQK